MAKLGWNLRFLAGFLEIYLHLWQQWEPDGRIMAILGWNLKFLGELQEICFHLWQQWLQNWDLATNSWVNVINVFYYYSLHQIVGITDNNISGISIYPNPVSQSITIENVEINATIKVYDMSGRLQISEIATTEKQVVDLSKLGKGVYVLSISDDTRTVSVKFIKD